MQVSENTCGCIESLMPRIRSTEYKSQLTTTYLGIYFVQECKKYALVKTSSFTSSTHSMLTKYASLKFIELNQTLIQYAFKRVPPNFRSLDRYYRKIRTHLVPNISQKYLYFSIEILCQMFHVRAHSSFLPSSVCLFHFSPVSMSTISS